MKLRRRKEVICDSLQGIMQCRCFIYSQLLLVYVFCTNGTLNLNILTNLIGGQLKEFFARLPLKGGVAVAYERNCFLTNTLSEAIV